MSRGYAEFSKTHKQESAMKKPAGGIDDLSRIVLLLILGLAALAGYFFKSHYNKPMNVIKSSISKTISKPYKASIEGKTSLQDSIIDVYRERESYVPEKGPATESSPGSAASPLNTRIALDMVRDATRVFETDREDMYGHPSRHFYGEITLKNSNPGLPSGYYFEYWADMRNLAAVRLMLTGVRRDVAVNAKGDSVSAETMVNIRFY